MQQDAYKSAGFYASQRLQHDIQVSFTRIRRTQGQPFTGQTRQTIIQNTIKIFVIKNKKIKGYFRIILVLRGMQERAMKTGFKNIFISGKKMLAVDNKTIIVGNCGAKWSLVGKGKDASFIAKPAMN